MVPIKAPSGLQVEIRGLRGKEMRILQDRGAQKNGTLVGDILSACVPTVTDSGPYDPEKLIVDGKIAWDAVLIGDRFFLLLAVRSETFGDDYSFRTQCPECRHAFAWELKLGELPVKHLSKEDAQTFRAGEPFSTKLGGKTAKFRLGLGKDEREIGKQFGSEKSFDNAIVAMLARRITEFDGRHEHKAIRELLEDCSMRDLNAFMKEFGKRDCGVETAIETECPKCEHRTEINLPLEKGFWFPA